MDLDLVCNLSILPSLSPTPFSSRRTKTFIYSGLRTHKLMGLEKWNSQESGFKNWRFERGRSAPYSICANSSSLSRDKSICGKLAWIDEVDWNCLMWRVGISWLNLSRCDCQRKRSVKPFGRSPTLFAEVNRENVNPRWICLDVTVNEKVDGALRASADFVVEVNPENANSEIRSPIRNYQSIRSIITAERSQNALFY